MLGVTDNMAGSIEYEQQMQAIREARETGGKKKETSFHSFGINDKLFTPKFEVNKNERNFNKLIKNMEEEINEKEAQKAMY